MLIPVLLLAAGAIAVSSYAMGKSLSVRSFRVDGAPASLKGKRMVLFSDVHLSRLVSAKQYKRCCDKINEQHADYIFFGGDFASRHTFDYSKDERDIIRMTNRLNASCGKYAVWGNNDYVDEGGVLKEFSEHVFKKGGFKILCDSGEYLCDGVFIAGVSSVPDGEADVEKSLEERADTAYTIMLAHRPDVADTSSLHNVQLQLSGHSHGGQIRIPFLYRFFLPTGGKKYISGRYDVNGMQLFVSNGVGLHTLPFRFLAPPDITVIDFE